MPRLQDLPVLLGKMAQVGGHIAWERATNYRPVTAGEVPPSAESITPEWLTSAICGGTPGAKVLSVRTAEGSTGTSSRRAIRVTYNDAGNAAGLPASLYTKATSKWTQRMVLGLAGVIPGESAFFNVIRPRIDVEAPRGWFAAFHEPSYRSITIMEDIVASRGVSFCSAKTPISQRDMEDLLAVLATLHGTFWESPLLQRELAHLMTPADFRNRISALINMRPRSEIGARRAEAVIPKAVFSRQDALWEGYGRSFEKLSRAPLTIVHGDSHIGNTYRTREGRMGFGDWQIVQRSGWAYDFALIVNTGLRVEDRRQWDGDLLRFYLDRLAAAGGAKLRFEDAWLAYRQSSFYPYFSWVYTIGAGRLQPDMQPRDLCLLTIERAAHAIEDLDALGSVGL